VAQEWLGDQFFLLTGFSPPHFLQQASFDVPLTDIELNVASFFVGVAISAVVLSLFAYPLVYTIAAFIPQKPHLEQEELHFPRK